MTEAEGRALAALPKFGEPSVWSQQGAYAQTNVFGVTGADGKTIKGLHVELEVITTPRLGLSKYILTLRRVEYGMNERAYQMEVNCRPHLRETDHAYSHEHFGEEWRRIADSSWANAKLQDAVTLFCEKCNLTLLEPLPDNDTFELK